LHPINCRDTPKLLRLSEVIKHAQKERENNEATREFESFPRRTDINAKPATALGKGLVTAPYQ